MPTLRGTNQVYSASANTLTLTLPSGSLAGDLALVTSSSGWVPNTPSGWTVLIPNTGGSWQSALFSKVLTAGDISAGSVTLTYSNTFDCFALIAVMVGAADNVGYSYTVTGSTPQTLNYGGFGHNGDVFLYFGTVRSAGLNTVSRGTLQQQGNDGSSGSGCLFAETISGILEPPIPVVYTYPGGAGSGNFCLVVQLTDSGATALVTQLGTNTIVASPIPKAQLTQLGVSALVKSLAPNAQLTQIGTSVIIPSAPPPTTVLAKVTQVGLNVIIPSVGYAEGNIHWLQLAADQRQGTGAYGQSSDGTGKSGDVPVYAGDGLTLTDSGVQAAGLLSIANQTIFPINIITHNRSMLATDFTIVAAAPALVITLPPAIDATGHPLPVGKIVHVKNGNSITGQLITVQTLGGYLIDTVTSLNLGATASLTVQWDGTQWRVL